MTQTPSSTGKRSFTLLISVLVFLAAARLLLLVLAPHQDPSEARYAEIARKMVETGDWITPQHLYGVPFWAKPPLSMWLSAAGMEIFGIHEFGSRIFIFAAAAAILVLTGRWAAREWNRETGLAAAIILLGSPLFFYCSAAVMTDLALTAGTTLSMIAFIEAVRGGKKAWGYLFFTGLAIGLLAKGPLALVIALPPVAGWALLTKRIRTVGKSLPWFSGTLLMLALSVPWYLLAEQRTPGFLDYFILGEHWHRFFDSGWKGDLYGKAHAKPPGMIWIFFLAGTFPWCLGLLALPFRRWREFPRWLTSGDGTGLYLTLWAVWPVLFFTPARNAIATYPLPALPAFALLISGILHRSGNPRPLLRPALSGICVLLVSAATALTLCFPLQSPKHSERELVRLYREESQPGDALVYFGRRQYSGEFYSDGLAANTRSISELETLLNRDRTLFLAITPKHYAALPESIRTRFLKIAAFGKHSALYRENPARSREISSN